MTIFIFFLPLFNYFIFPSSSNYKVISLYSKNLKSDGSLLGQLLHIQTPILFYLRFLFF